MDTETDVTALAEDYRARCAAGLRHLPAPALPLRGAQGGTVIELGVRTGNSTAAFLAAGAEVWSVDTERSARVPQSGTGTPGGISCAATTWTRPSSPRSPRKRTSCSSTPRTPTGRPSPNCAPTRPAPGWCCCTTPSSSTAPTRAPRTGRWRGRWTITAPRRGSRGRTGPGPTASGVHRRGVRICVTGAAGLHRPAPGPGAGRARP